MATAAQLALAREKAKGKTGRKKGAKALIFERTREYIAQEIEKELAPMVKALIADARNGDVSSFRELFDRAFGKAPQRQEHTGEEGGPIVITWQK